jgi:hypothetical protein
VRYFLVSLLLIICLISGFIGWQLKTDSLITQYYKEIPDKISKAEIVDFLIYAESTHQYYADNPDKVNEFTGTPEQNAKWVRLYKIIIMDYMRGD